MSKAISLIAAGASAALLEAAAGIVSKATGGAVKVVPAEVAVCNAVAVGTDAPRGVYACVVRPSSHPDAVYAGVKTAVVRAILPREPAHKLQLRDLLDVYPAAGIDCAEEVRRAADAFGKAAQVAVQVAKESGASRVTLVVKQVSQYQRLNDLFLHSAMEVIEGAGLTTERMGTARAANELVMFPERHAVVLVNDDPVCENVQRAFAGLTGGAAATYYIEAGGSLSGGFSFKTVALAVAQELKALGMASEALKIEMAVAKGDPRNVLTAF